MVAGGILCGQSLWEDRVCLCVFMKEYQKPLAFRFLERGTGVSPVCCGLLLGSEGYAASGWTSLHTAETAMPPSFAVHESKIIQLLRSLRFSEAVVFIRPSCLILFILSSCQKFRPCIHLGQTLISCFPAFSPAKGPAPGFAGSRGLPK